MIAVIGNNDIGDKENLLEASKEFNCDMYDEPFFFNLKNRNICIVHHPELINEDLLKKSDVVFHGHTHRYRNEKINNTLIFNPGECAGFLKGKNQIGIVDIDSLQPKTMNF